MKMSVNFVAKTGFYAKRATPGQTLMLISLYEEMKELFKNVNYKKKNKSGK